MLAAWRYVKPTTHTRSSMLSWWQPGWVAVHLITAEMPLRRHQHSQMNLSNDSFRILLISFGITIIGVTLWQQDAYSRRVYNGTHCQWAKAKQIWTTGSRNRYCWICIQSTRCGDCDTINTRVCHISFTAERWNDYFSEECFRWQANIWQESWIIFHESFFCLPISKVLTVQMGFSCIQWTTVQFDLRRKRALPFMQTS